MQGARQQLESFEKYFGNIEPECSIILARRNDLPIIPKEVEGCDDKEAAHKKGYRDLQQAVRAANAAEDAAWLSYLQTRASIVGAALVLLTLGATAWAAWAAADAACIAKDSAVAANRAADAAESAVDVARSTAQTQLRAYLLHNLTQVVSIEPPDRVRANIKFKNSGQTPAQDVLMMVGITVGVVGGDPPDFGFPDVDAQSKGALAPDAGIEAEPVSSRPFTDIEYAAFLAGQLRIYAFGHVTYRDIFNGKHRTKIRVFYDASSIERGTETFSTDVDGNEAT